MRFVWGNVRSGTPGQLGWTGELRDPTTNLVYLRARDYSPGTGRFTSRDSLIPNAPGTQGYNPYWYANDNPATLTDPSGKAANCGICTPMAVGVAVWLAARQAELAARAPYQTRTVAGARAWSNEGLAFAAFVLVCAITPSCRELGSPLTGAIDEASERLKRASDSLADVFQSMLERVDRIPYTLPLSLAATIVGSYVRTEDTCKVVKLIPPVLRERRRAYVERNHGPNARNPNRAHFNSTVWEALDLFITGTIALADNIRINIGGSGQEGKDVGRWIFEEHWAFRPGRFMASPSAGYVWS